MLFHWLRYRKLMRQISTHDGIVPEWLFDYCGHQRTAGHIHSYLYASQFAGEADILDAGCGSGYGTEMLASCAGRHRITGIDASPDAIRYCRLVRKRANLRFARMDVRSMAFPDESFDLVTSFEVIEHFAEYEAFLTEVMRILRPGGHFVLATPNGTNRRLRGIQNPYHIHEFTYDELRAVLSRYFSQVQVLCRHLKTQEAENIEYIVNQAEKRYHGVRLLMEWSKRARLMYLILPHALLDWYFRRRTGYPIYWYGPALVRLEPLYSDDAYAFLATGVKE